jgi:hypothetical protein
MPKTSWILALTAVLLLLLLGHGFGLVLTPDLAPMWSRVHYDPNLTEDVLTRLMKMVSLSTDKCYFTSFGIKKGVVCKLTLIRPDYVHVSISKERLEYLHGETPDDYDPEYCGETLNVEIIKGMFRCYHERRDCIKPGCGYWCKATTKRQELTLDKQTYRKGDVITGRIDFECLVECPQCPEKPEPVIVKGVFRTILK